MMISQVPARTKAALAALCLAAACSPARAALSPEDDARSNAVGFAARLSDASTDLRFEPPSRALHVRVDRTCLGGLAARGAESLFTSSVEEGLRRLARYSPGLAAMIRAKAAGRDLLLRCDARATFEGVYDPRDSSIVMKDIGGVEEASADSSEKAARIFHEFLHFSGLDNLPVDVHNERLGINGKQLDRVYSCENLAFPGLLSAVSEAPCGSYRDRGGQLHEMTCGAPSPTRLSCETCLGPGSPEAARCREFPEGPPPHA